MECVYIRVCGARAASSSRRFCDAHHLLQLRQFTTANDVRLLGRRSVPLRPRATANNVQQLDSVQLMSWPSGAGQWVAAPQIWPPPPQRTHTLYHGLWVPPLRDALEWPYTAGEGGPPPLPPPPLPAWARGSRGRGGGGDWCCFSGVGGIGELPVSYGAFCLYTNPGLPSPFPLHYQWEDMRDMRCISFQPAPCSGQKFSTVRATVRGGPFWVKTLSRALPGDPNHRNMFRPYTTSNPHITTDLSYPSW